MLPKYIKKELEAATLSGILKPFLCLEPPSDDP